MAERLALMFLFVSHLYISGVTSKNITIENKCDFTVWPGIQTDSDDSTFRISGFILKKGETREVDTPSAWKGRIWGRSRCSTNSTGSFSCQTGDCGSGQIECLGNAGTPLVTLAEFDFENYDNYYVSVVSGYNLPLLIAPQDDLTCSSIGCMVLVNQKTCGGEDSRYCISPCAELLLPERCCDLKGNYAATEKCQVTLDMENSKSNCPHADNFFTCTDAIGYIITFCPSRVLSTMTPNISKDIAPALPPTDSGTQSPNQAPKKSTFGAKQKRSWKLKLKLGVLLGASVIIIIAVFVVMVRAKHARKSRRTEKNVEAVVMLRQYSYARVKKMTNSFAHVLGKGGFGTVYKGKLPDGGRDVAVKILKEANGNGEEFINEIASMSRTSHVNIVPLLGFCYEGNKRAIIYDFMPNGSLDKFIAETMSAKMEWQTLYKIVVGLSRGLEYLHNRCVSRIVHFDIKPQNILMDTDFCPKIADFGLAKLCKNNESIMSTLDARGTFGYIAPEVISKTFGGVSHKSDVYSYGMVVLEMIGARNIENFEKSGSNNSSMYFPDWIYKDSERGEIKSFFGDQITEEEEKIAKKMVLVGLWCIQTNPSDRPAMIKVIEMLEGSIETLQVPPKPLLCLPAVPVPEVLEDINETSSFSNPSQIVRGTSSGEDTIRSTNS